MGRVGFGHSLIGKLDLVKMTILHGPEDIAPCLVQPVNRLVALRQPVPKSGQIDRAARQGCIMASIFIVGLPADNSRMVAKLRRNNAGDACAFAPVSHMRKAVMTARSKAALRAIARGGQHVRHGVDQPFWRGGRRGTENHFDVMAVQQIQNFLHPVQIDGAGLGFGDPPGKFTDADKIDAKGTHLCRIRRPVCRVPMFGKIANAKLSARHCVHAGNQSRWAVSRSLVMALIWVTSSSAAVCGSNMAAWKICSRFSSTSAATTSS